MKKIKIKLEEWSYDCADGCCTNYGTDIYINGKKIEGEDGTSNQQLLEVVLRELGYEIEWE